MATIAEHVLLEALRLPTRERGEIIARLLDSLEVDDDPDAEDAWDDEIRQRLDEVQSGKVKPVTWEEALKQIMRDDDSDEG